MTREQAGSDVIDVVKTWRQTIEAVIDKEKTCVKESGCIIKGSMACVHIVGEVIDDGT